MVLDLLNSLMLERRFPTAWKKAKPVLVPKPGKDQRDMSGFRPICLLDTMGKLYEALSLGRFQGEIVRTGSLNDLQFGFRKEKSTVDAIQEAISIIKRAGQNKWRAMILLYVKNAFNTAS